jgi:hypothetical protein
MQIRRKIARGRAPAAHDFDMAPERMRDFKDIPTDTIGPVSLLRFERA